MPDPKPRWEAGLPWCDTRCGQYDRECMVCSLEYPGAGGPCPTVCIQQIREDYAELKRLQDVQPPPRDTDPPPP